MNRSILAIMSLAVFLLTTMGAVEAHACSWANYFLVIQKGKILSTYTGEGAQVKLKCNAQKSACEARMYELTGQIRKKTSKQNDEWRFGVFKFESIDIIRCVRPKFIQEHLDKGAHVFYMAIIQER